MGFARYLILASATLALAADSSVASGSAASTTSAATTDTASSAASSSASASASASASTASESQTNGTSSTSSSSASYGAATDIVISSDSHPSSKRGLVYVPPTVQADNDFWDSSSSDMTWYYNYGASPTAIYSGSKMQFIPMLWGAPGNPQEDMTFYNTVSNLIDAGQNITYILGFNEPDGCNSGGSCVDAGVAATVWKKQIEPLKKKYPQIKIGGPAVTGSPAGFTWLENWQENCAGLSSNSTNCEMDFLPVHWYGNFAGLASHLGQVNGTFAKNVSSLWVTEFALPESSLEDSQQFYNQSTEYLDRLPYVSYYSYFGAFRSDVSNVGPNAAFLTQDGKLTDIGSWYLGGVETNNIPSSATGFAGPGSPTFHEGGTYSGKPYSSGNRFGVFTGWTLCIATAVLWSLS